MLYDNYFNYKYYYNNIGLHNLKIDNDGILVIMCCWKRIQYLEKTIKMLEKQNIKQKINLFIWNNNFIEKEKIDIIINNNSNFKINIFCHHSNTNIGGIGRFILTKFVCEKINHFKHVIFIDDDQIFDNYSFQILLDNVEDKKSFNWSGKIFNNNSYWKGWSNIYHTEINNSDYLDYGGTGFMIINTECFLMESFYNFNEKYKFIEDLWMSYFVINKLGYKIKNAKELKNKVKIIEGENESPIAQVNLLKELKEEFLNLLRIEGCWNV